MRKAIKVGTVLFGILALFAGCADPFGGADNDVPDPEAFITVWQTNAKGYERITNDDQIKFPLAEGGVYDFIIDWGDGTQDSITSWNQPETRHTYHSPGVYEVTVTGVMNGFGFGYSDLEGLSDAAKILDVRQWGSVVLRNDGAQFMGAENLAGFSAVDAPDLSSITNLDYMLEYAWEFNGEMGHWDTSNIESMEEMFFDVFEFDQDISAWDTSNVRNMRAMFLWARRFNQDLSGWDTSNVQDMSMMFSEAQRFNQDLSTWCVNQIPSEPFAFDQHTDAWTEPRPVWGTCP